MAETPHIKVKLKADFSGLIRAFREAAAALETLQTALGDATVDEQDSTTTEHGA